MARLYPVQIQADNQDANDSHAVALCHVFDIQGELTIINALCKQYMHVISWDAQGEKLSEYDNR